MASEIDDIFAAKGKVPAPAPSMSLAKVSENKDKKKRKNRPTNTAADKPKATKKRPAPETVVDPSQPQSQPRAKRPKVGKVLKSSFADSRGTESRRKTEEGWSIYKEDELGIGDKGGDTPLCPFDCDCCF